MHETMSDVRKAALAMGPLIREQADDIERQRRLTPPVVAALKKAGVYAMSIPKAWGGLELDLPEQLLCHRNSFAFRRLRRMVRGNEHQQWLHVFLVL